MRNTLETKTDGAGWPAAVHDALAGAGVKIVSYVPDAGHKRLIELCQEDESMRVVPLTTEEEGVGLALGAWLGGERSVLLLQSSGVGNLVNTLGSAIECRAPLLMIVAMRGEDGEFNPWQLPMGRATVPILEEFGVGIERVEDPARAGPAVSEASDLAFSGDAIRAILLSQSLIGIKSFQEQADR